MESNGQPIIRTRRGLVVTVGSVIYSPGITKGDGSAFTVVSIEDGAIMLRSNDTGFGGVHSAKSLDKFGFTATR